MRVASLFLISLCGCYVGSEVGPARTGAVPSAGEGSSSTTGASAPDTGDASSAGAAPNPPGPTGGDTPAAGSTSGAPQTGVETSGDASASSGEQERLVGCDALPAALLCEDFEDALDPRIWEFVTAPGGELSIQDGRLEVHIGAQEGAHAMIRTHAVFPLQNNRLFGRVMLRISPYSPTGHDYLLAAEGPLDGSVARYRLDSNNNGRLNSRYTHASVEQHGGWRKLGHQTQGETWTCIEWEFDGASNSIRFWFDGELDAEMLVDGVTEDPPWRAPAFERFELGYHTYQAPVNGDDFRVTYDNLVLDTAPIGCPDYLANG